MESSAIMLKGGERFGRDYRHAVIWSATGDSYIFWELLVEAKQAMKSGATEDLESNFNQLCYSIGWGLYWYQYGSEDWNGVADQEGTFSSSCLDFYCSCVELQQKSIFTFLLFWNRTTGGVKGPGQMIAQMVWTGKESTRW
jgi:hypothetical protein